MRHKTTAPFCDWGIEQLAASFSLGLIDSTVFNIADYPGYHNKRGDGGRCDMPFPIGKSSTHKFTITEPKKKKKRKNKRHSNSWGEPIEPALFEASTKSQWIPLSKKEVRITHCNTCDESEKQVLETCQDKPMIDLVDKRVLDSQGLKNESDEADKQLDFEFFGERQRLPLDEERKSASNKVLHFTTFGELPDKLAVEFASERMGIAVNQAGNPGYSNERGGGQSCDEQFAVVKSRTCNFTISNLRASLILISESLQEWLCLKSRESSI